MLAASGEGSMRAAGILLGPKGAQDGGPSSSVAPASATPAPAPASVTIAGPPPVPAVAAKVTSCS